MRGRMLALSAATGVLIGVAGVVVLATEGGEAHGGVLHDLSHVALLGGVGCALAPILARPVGARGYATSYFVALAAWLLTMVAVSALGA